MEEIILIILILAGVWYWWDTQQSNEIALLVCRQKCSNMGLQLLDATVTRQRTWLRRGSGGSLQICRLYSFEYTGGQATEFPIDPDAYHYGAREHAYIVLIGKQVVETSLPSQPASTGSNSGETIH
jgi:hypothetical protein